MNILIAVASKHGSTREIAEAIAEELRDAKHTVDLHNADAVQNLASYDAVILSSAVYAANWLPEAKVFAERFREELDSLPIWLFSSGPIGADDPKPHDNPERLAAALSGVAIRDHQIFVGKLDKRNLSLAERMISKVVGAPEGDFRDWNTIRAWAREIAGAVAELAPAV